MSVCMIVCMSSILFSLHTGPSQESSQDWFQTQMSPREKLNLAMKQLTENFQPIECILSKPWNDLSKSSKRYYVNKGMECISVILNILAPGQEDTLLQSIVEDSNMSEEDWKTTKAVIDAYNNVSDTRTKTQILSVIVNNHTKG